MEKGGTNFNIIHHSGKKSQFDSSILLSNLQSLGSDLKYLDLDLVVRKVKQGLVDNIKTSELTDLISQTAAYLNVVHPNYSLLASRVVVQWLHKRTPSDLLEYAEAFYNYEDIFGRKCQLL